VAVPPMSKGQMLIRNNIRLLMNNVPVEKASVIFMKKFGFSSFDVGPLIY